MLVIFTWYILRQAGNNEEKQKPVTVAVVEDDDIEVTRRSTQTVGGTAGNAFDASSGNNAISQLTFYNHDVLTGIRITYSDNTGHSIGDTSGHNFYTLDAVIDPIRSITVFTDEQSSQVFGIRFTQRSGTASVFGCQTEYSRSSCLPRESRLVGVSGRELDDCIISISFTYLASLPAFEPATSMVDENIVKKARASDEKLISSEKNLTWSEHAYTALSVGVSAVAFSAVLGAGGVAAGVGAAIVGVATFMKKVIVKD
eukprot:g2690.t1